MNGPWRRLAAMAAPSSSRLGLAERQAHWLRACLERNRDTLFGREHDFASIRDVDTYRRRVPLSDYDGYRPLIERLAAGEPDTLFAGRPVAFETTGGTSGGAKMIPYGMHALADFRTAVLPWLASTVTDHRIEGAAYFAISPACRRPTALPSGIPVGLPDGAYLGEDVLGVFAEVSAVPPWVGTLTEPADWRLATLHHLLRRPDLELISVWSPTFLTGLLDALDGQADALVALLRAGGEFDGHPVEPDVDAEYRLTSYLRRRESHLLWPRLKLVSAWADATSRPYYERLRERLPHAAFQGKGLLSTEGVVTVPDREGRCLLTADSGFYEFLDEAGEAHLPETLLEGERYEVVITTAGGLYRYRTGDLLRCEGWVEDIPHLAFEGRGGLASDLVGEKLTEAFVGDCLVGIDGFRMLVPRGGPTPGYLLVLDAAVPIDPQATAAEVERRLARNPQYAYARRIGQLAPLTPLPLARPLEHHAERLHREGVRLGDIKPAALSTHPGWNRYIEGLP